MFKDDRQNTPDPSISAEMLKTSYDILFEKMGRGWASPIMFSLMEVHIFLFETNHHFPKVLITQFSLFSQFLCSKVLLTLKCKLLLFIHTGSTVCSLFPFLFINLYIHLYFIIM
jgi:hypothetical protein